MAKKSKELAKDLKKLKKTVKEVRERNEELVGEVEELREGQRESRRAFEAALRDLESRFESPGVEGDGEASSSVTVGADGAIVTGSEGSAGAPEGSVDAPRVSADDEISRETESPEAETRKNPKATEAAARKAEELGVSLVGVEGTGSRDRITVEDVERAARGT